MNVEVKEIVLACEPPETTIAKKIVLVARKDFQAGEEIYKEHPVVGALDMDLEGSGRHCSHCFRAIQSFLSIRPAGDPLGCAYCSKECQVLANTQSHSLLFGEGSPIPNDPAPRTEEAERKANQKAFAVYLQQTGKIQPLLASRFLACLVAEEINKLAPSTSLAARSNLPEPSPGSPSYTFYDHLERLKYLEIPPSPAEERESQMVREVLRTAMTGLEEFVENDKYSVLKGKMAYNVIGVTFGGGRSDKPTQKSRTEDWERSRTPYGTARQIGSALYRVSSYLNHSCSPSVRPSFASGTNELHLVASRQIAKGEELTMAYINVLEQEGQSSEDARRARRVELARGWRFACACERCIGKKAPTPIQSYKPKSVQELPVNGMIHI